MGMCVSTYVFLYESNRFWWKWIKWFKLSKIYTNLNNNGNDKFTSFAKMEKKDLKRIILKTKYVFLLQKILKWLLIND